MPLQYCGPCLSPKLGCDGPLVPLGLAVLGGGPGLCTSRKLFQQERQKDRQAGRKKERKKRLYS